MVEPSSFYIDPATAVAGSDLLAALSRGQREVLALLAEGHTAKSISRETGLFLAAVNERLRAARRRTGVASSRELARRMRLQENRGDEIVVPTDRANPDAASKPLASPQRRSIVPSLILLVALAVATIHPQADAPPVQPAPQPTPPDPLLGTLVGEGGTVSDLHRRIRVESRDAAWATTAEAELRERYGRFAGLRERGPIRVVCAPTLCEVAALLPRRAAPVLWAELQGDPLRRDLAGFNLEMAAAGFGDAFVAYLSRRPRAGG